MNEKQLAAQAEADAGFCANCQCATEDCKDEGCVIPPADPDPDPDL
jgi:hypothetical protein